MSTLGAAFCQTDLEQNYCHGLRLKSLQEERADLTDPVNKQKIILGNSREALEKKNVARKALAFVLCAVGTQSSDFIAQNLSFE